MGKADSYVAYGAALAGSPLEIKNLRANKVTICNLKNLNWNAMFHFSDFQDTLYTTDDFGDVVNYINSLRQFAITQ
jgi:hypothetical protein